MEKLRHETLQILLDLARCDVTPRRWLRRLDLARRRALESAQHDAMHRRHLEMRRQCAFEMRSRQLGSQTNVRCKFDVQ